MAEVRNEPLGYQALDEISKAYGKSMSDVNSHLISAKDKKAELPPKAPEIDVMNFIVLKN